MWCWRLRLILLSNRTEYTATRLLIKPAFRALVSRDDWVSIAGDCCREPGDTARQGTRTRMRMTTVKTKHRAADEEQGSLTVWSMLVFFTQGTKTFFETSRITDPIEVESFCNKKRLFETFYCFESMMVWNRKKKCITHGLPTKVVKR